MTGSTGAAGATYALTSGKEVSLHDLTVADRQDCEDAISHRYSSSGEVVLEGLAKARNMWCCKGLYADLEELADYTVAELNEIALEVRRRAGQFRDPIGQEG